MQADAPLDIVTDEWLDTCDPGKLEGLEGDQQQQEEERPEAVVQPAHVPWHESECHLRGLQDQEKDEQRGAGHQDHAP